MVSIPQCFHPGNGRAHRISVRKSPNRCWIFHQGNKYSNKDPILAFFLISSLLSPWLKPTGSWRERKPADGSTVCQPLHQWSRWK